jgi:hypothetical protein
MNFVSRLRYPPLLIAGILFIASLILYVGTLAPSVVALFDDSLEFQLVTYQLGIAHPTGYPLYTLLGNLFTLLPVGDVAYRVNLMSAVFGAATVALVYLLILQVAPPRQGLLLTREADEETGDTARPIPTWPTHLGGLVGALLLAVGPVFWQQATVAEVYTLNAFFVALLLLLSTLLPACKGPAGWLSLAFLAGLSLTHHRSMLLLFPALGLYLLLYGDKSQLFRPKTVLLGLLLFVLPLLLYLYLPLRGSVGSLDGTFENSWAGFWRQISGGGYGLFLLGNPFGQSRTPEFYGTLVADQFYTAALGYVGVAYLLFFGQRKLLVLTGAAFITYFIFNLSYNVADIEVFFIPNFVIWGVYSGAGAAFLLFAAGGIKLRSAKRQAPAAIESPEEAEPGPVESEPIEPPARPEATENTATSPPPEPIEAEPSSGFNPWLPALLITTLAIFGLMIFQLFRTSLTVVNQNHTWQVHDYGLDILQQPLPAARNGGSAIVGILGEMTLIRYFQQTEQRRPDVETVAADLEADRILAVERLLAVGKTVYLTRELPGAPERWSLGAEGPLVRINQEPVTSSPEFSISVDRAISPEIRLLGYSTSRLPHHGEGPLPLRLNLFWQVVNPLTADLKLSVPYPTSAWRSGEIISDVYDLTLPVTLPPGRYTPRLIWYNPSENAAEVARIDLEPLTLN